MNEAYPSHNSQDQSGASIIKWVLVLLLLIVIAGAGYMAMKNFKSSAAGTLKSGRQVTIESDSLYLNGSFANNTAVLETAGVVIKVESDGVWLDDEMVEELDPKSKKVDITYVGGKLTVDAKAPESDEE